MCWLCSANTVILNQHFCPHTKQTAVSKHKATLLQEDHSPRSLTAKQQQPQGVTDIQTLRHLAPSPFVPYQQAQTAFWPHPDQPANVCASPHVASMHRANKTDAGTSCSSIQDNTLLVCHKSPRQSMACNLNELQVTVWTSSYNVRVCK